MASFVHKKVSDIQNTNGWFFGHFMAGKGFPELQNENIEIAWKKVDHTLKDPIHIHKQCLEVNIIIKGSYTVKVNGEVRKLSAGEFLVVNPNTPGEVISCEDDTEIIVVKTPSVVGDKFDL